MIDTLKRFTNESLFSATSALLEKLHIQFDRETAEPMSIADFWEGAMPQYLRDAQECILATYFIGIVNDGSLQGDKTAESLDSVAETMEHGGKYDGMFIFAVDAKREANLTRSVTSSLTRAFNRIASANPVILFIRQGSHLSISTCERMEYSQAWRQGTGEKLGKVNILRNINCEHPHRGHVDILEGLKAADCNTFDKLYEKWLKVFNSEVLTKKFYNELFEWYQWAVNPETKVTFPGDADTPEDDREDIDTRVIRLITRLMFVWFIKQKDLVPDKIFDEEQLQGILKNFDPQSPTDSNYYQAILQNLFFGTLNRAILEDGEVRGFAKASKIDVRNLYRYEELFAINEQEVIDMFATVPYLNCGLFECQDKCKTLDGVQRRFYNDGFSRNTAKFANGVYRYRAVVPNILFFHPDKGILSIFKRYVFTIEENTPQDVQVALDPELLGKVFENLLGAYNPETKETARNQSGSFYTPREIVQYMVNESLVAHLKRTVGEELEPEYRQLMDFSEKEVSLTQEQKSKILHSLFTCKILDPACGSGAFPMGMLQQMVHILQQVDPDNTQWRHVLENLAVEDSYKAFGIKDEEERNAKLADIRDTFNNALNYPDYTRKLYIIESCIYGVDIQPIAMLITRLRFFISLICEQKEIRRDDPEHNFGIKTLPNLESKFVAANSLIDADIHKYNQDWTNNEELAKLKEELIAVRRRHFYTRNRNEKISLLNKDEKLREQIHKLINDIMVKPDEVKISLCKKEIAKQEAELPNYAGEKWEESIEKNLFGETIVTRTDKNKDKRNKINAIIQKCKADIEHEYNKTILTGFEAAVLQITDWNPYDQSKVSPFLDIEWMFGLTDGFDIVIGNPPYIQLQAEKGKLAKLYEPCDFDTFKSTGDIFCLFYERGNNLLKDKGLLCYITSNKWMRAGYGDNLRKYLTTKTNPVLLIDFGETHVFESATVMTNILIFKNEDNNYHLHSTQVKEDFTDPSNIRNYVDANHIYCKFEGTESWVIMPDSMRAIKKNVETQGKPLEDWELSIYRGILTGYNPAFYLSTNQRNAIVDACTSDEERKITEEIIRPMLRGKDVRKYGCNWADLWLIGTFPTRKLEIDNLPAIEKHLLTFTKERLEQTGTTHIVNGEKIKSRKKTSGKWFETQDSIKYWPEFYKPKIIYPNMTKYMPFYYDEENYLTNQKCFIITGEHMSYLTAFFNSSLFKFCFFDNFPVLFGGSRELSKIFFDKIPVKEVDDATDEEFRTLVLDIQKEYSDDKAKAIDQKIFDLYGLTQEERDMVGYIDFHNNGEEDGDE